jgi:hypothetical protein
MAALEAGGVPAIERRAAAEREVGGGVEGAAPPVRSTLAQPGQKAAVRQSAPALKRTSAQRRTTARRTPDKHPPKPDDTDLADG